MHKKNIIILTLTIIITLLFSSCFLQKETTDKPKNEPFSEEKATTAALAYLNKKYGEEFVSINSIHMTDGVLFSGNEWQEIGAVRKSEQNEEYPLFGKVCVSRDSNYTIIGETFILTFYSALYEEFAEPLIAKEMGDIPFVLLVERLYEFCDGTTGVSPEAKIPRSLDDEDSIMTRHSFETKIYIPESYDNGQIQDLCRKIAKTLTEKNYYRSFIITLDDKDFAKFYDAKNKYEARNKLRFVGRKTYNIK